MDNFPSDVEKSIKENGVYKIYHICIEVINERGLRRKEDINYMDSTTI